MIKAFFLALGIFICLLGAECLVIEKAVLADIGRRQSETQTVINMPREKREVVPPDWAPWGLLAGGVIVVIYSFAIPRRVRG